MSKKYVIEIKPEYENTTKGIMVLGARDSNLYVDALAVENLEELNSDYINEHFSQLQDDAYQRGVEDGRNETWEAARKIVLSPDEGGMSSPTLFAIFGRGSMQNVLRNYSAPQVIEKMKAYEEKQKKKQKTEDDIKVGDGLEHTARGCTSKAIFLEQIEYYDEYWYRCLFWTGCEFTILCYPKSQFKRTGKHYDIEKILEEMKRED